MTFLKIALNNKKERLANPMICRLRSAKRFGRASFDGVDRRVVKQLTGKLFYMTWHTDNLCAKKKCHFGNVVAEVIATKLSFD